MHARIEQVADGIAIVVPELLTAKVGLQLGGSAEVEWNAGQLVVRTSGPLTLADMLAGITSENLHDEWASGLPAGKELL